MIAIGTLLPLASLAIKLGSKLLGDSTSHAQTEPAVQEAHLAPTVQSLFQRLGIQEADSEQNRPAINHFMGALMQTLGQESSDQPLPQAIDAARTQLADGTQSTRLDALQSELDTLKGSLGNSEPLRVSSSLCSASRRVLWVPSANWVRAASMAWGRG